MFMNKVIVTRLMVGICHMQVCAHKDATDDEIVAVANRENPPGTSAGTSAGTWSVVREESEFWGDLRPVQCQDDPERMHYMLGC
jgi:hypothetical protein